MGKQKTHEEFIEEMKIKNNQIIILDKYINAKKKIKCKCKNCDTEWHVTPNNLLRGRGCPVCRNKIVRVGINSLVDTAPEIVEVLEYKEDGLKYSRSSSAKLNFICPNCGNHILKRLADVSRYGLTCQRCSDGMPYSEKLMREILISQKISFKQQKRFEWSKGKIYDFYIDDLKLIIETNGLQHYKGGFERLGGKTLFDEQNNDKVKLSLANKNGIKNYFSIDCRKSSLNWCKQSIINSGLLDFLKINKDHIDWEMCNDNALNSLALESCDLFNSGMTLMEISKQMNLSKDCIRKYIKQCTESNLCSYDQKKAQINFYNSNKKKVKCLNTGVIYESVSIAAKDNNTSSSTIIRACKSNDGNLKSLSTGITNIFTYYNNSYEVER